MDRIPFTRIVVSYIVSILVTVAILVVWVVYTIQARARIDELADRVGVTVGNVHWAVLAVGCGLAALLITELTSQLASRVAEARYARKQEEFISMVTHELKSPLAAIKLHAQTLQGPDVDREQLERSVGFILQQADRMGTLVDDVLESSRLVGRRKRLDLEPIALGEFFPDYFEEVRPRIESHGVRLTATVEADVAVRATEEALRRLADNLLENAARFSKTGGEVRARVGAEDHRAVIEVEDDGIGIPKKELSKVFDRFYQVGREVDQRRKGTGLGLFIVSGLVGEMGGTVRAFSHEGRPGTRFRIELPLLSAAAEPRSPEPGRAGAATGARP
ncbi:MAG: HAMP domain-containing sensor histidine kinase [Acidobacteriota bacterium]